MNEEEAGVLKERLLKEAEVLHARHEQAEDVGENGFDPDLPMYAARYDGRYEEKTGTLTLCFAAAGTGFHGRMEHIEHVKEGDPVKIVRDAGNRDNPDSFVLLNAKNQDIGLLPEELCLVMAPVYDAGYLEPVEAKVSFVIPMSERERYAVQPVLFAELVCRVK